MIADETEQPHHTFTGYTKYTAAVQNISRDNEGCLLLWPQVFWDMKSCPLETVRSSPESSEPSMSEVISAFQCFDVLTHVLKCGADMLDFKIHAVIPREDLNTLSTEVRDQLQHRHSSHVKFSAPVGELQ